MFEKSLFCAYVGSSICASYFTFSAKEQKGLAIREEGEADLRRENLQPLQLFSLCRLRQKILGHSLFTLSGDSFASTTSLISALTRIVMRDRLGQIWGDFIRSAADHERRQLPKIGN
jgi:hypothetical protein